MEVLSRLDKILFLAIAIFLGGCAEENICDMTPNIMPQNQSNIYTITMGMRGTDGGILQKTIRPYVVINGEKREMKKHPDGNNIFVYDHQFYDIGTIPYYFEVVYEIHRNESIREKIAKSELHSLTITNKYIFALDANRGPVGAKVNVVGCGLGKNDKVRMGRHIIPSNWLSAGAIEFTVPPIDCDREYEVFLLSNRKELFAGTFFIDASVLHCSSDYIRLNNGESQRLVFMLDQAAPEGGIVVDVTTDIPESIIMPEIRFMPGERTVSVNAKGSDQSGKGTLYVNAKGFASLEIPMEIGDISTLSDGELNDANTFSQGETFGKSNSAFPLQTSPAEDNDLVVL
jgi:hypothetical protein